MASMCGTVSEPLWVRDPGWLMAVNLDRRNAWYVVPFEYELGAAEPQCRVAPRPNRIEDALIPSGRLMVEL